MLYVLISAGMRPLSIYALGSASESRKRNYKTHPEMSNINLHVGVSTVDCAFFNDPVLLLLGTGG